MLEIVFQIEAGRRHKDIAAQFNITATRVSHIARRLGRPDRRRTRTKISTTAQQFMVN
jgi:hypothetical protein